MVVAPTEAAAAGADLKSRSGPNCPHAFGQVCPPFEDEARQSRLSMPRPNASNSWPLAAVTMAGPEMNKPLPMDEIGGVVKLAPPLADVMRVNSVGVLAWLSPSTRN